VKVVSITGGRHVESAPRRVGGPLDDFEISAADCARHLRTLAEGMQAAQRRALYESLPRIVMPGGKH